MKRKFSVKWKSSKQRRKQRKYHHNSPLHIKHKFLSAHLSKDLMKKYKIRSMPVRKGDTVKIARGNFKSHVGKIEKVFLKKTKVNVEGAQIVKKDGTKFFYPLHPSNLIITSLNLEDKRRQAIMQRKNVKTSS